jgi:lipopolysaccharide assembly protein A
MPSDAEQPSTGKRVRRFGVGHRVALILLTLTALFVAQNRSHIPFDVLWVGTNAPLWVPLAIVFCVGVFIDLLLHRRGG